MTGTKIIAWASGAAGALCATGLALAASASANNIVYPQGASSNIERIAWNARGESLAVRLLAAHNAERDRLHLPRLKWNSSLERAAGNWAQQLSHRGYLQHADQRTRASAGENLWMGAAGYWNVESMVGMFVDEKKYYRNDSFPNISRTGNWADVGHYSQMVWRDTQEVGCALETDRGYDVLVCRYWPAGNIWGQKAY